MKIPFISRGSAGFAAALAISIFSSAFAAEEPNRIVFEGNRSLPLDQVTVNGANFVVKSDTDGFKKGQTFPITLASYVGGEKPAVINEAIGLVMLGKPIDGLLLLEPLLEQQKVTAKIPGNFWIEAARAALVANAFNGASSKVEALAAEIADATPAAGDDPVAALGKALLMPSSSKLEDRLAALEKLVTDSNPPVVSAYASFFHGNLLKRVKRDKEALHSFLKVSCLYPTGGRVINGAAELHASEILNNLNRREEAVALLTSASREAKNTAAGAEADKRLKSLK